jgi:hypothetical protein
MTEASLRALVRDQDQQGQPVPVEGLLDLNILPSRFRRRKITPGLILPWALSLLLVSLLAPNYGMARQAYMEWRLAQDEFAAAQILLAENEPAQARLAELEQRLSQLTASREELLRSRSMVDLRTLDWGDGLRALLRPVPSGLQIERIEQSGLETVLHGAAAAYHQPLEYADELRTMSWVDQVRVVYIQRMEPAEADDDTLPAAETTAAPIYAYQITVTVRSAAWVP